MATLVAGLETTAQTILPLNDSLSDSIQSDTPSATDPAVRSSRMERLPTVAELSDVTPNDWTYQALQALIDRYRPIAGYPDRTFRGNRSLSRYEFAAALNAAIPTPDFSAYATKEDVEKVKQMQAEFARELAEVKSQFQPVSRQITPTSITTKLTGQAILAPIVVGTTDRADGEGRTDSALTLGSRVNLDFLSELDGKLLLRTTLSAQNVPELQRATGTDMSRLGFQGDNDSQVEVSELSLRYRLADRANFYAFATGGGLDKFTETLNPFVGSSSQGSISRFGQRNPIYRQGGDVGLGISYDFGESVSLDLGYVGDRLNRPGTGIANASYGTIAQLTWEASRNFGLGLSYVRSFNSLDTGTGSELANDPFDGESDAIVANSWGLSASWGLSRDLVVSGWTGWTWATAKDLPDDPTANIFNWAVTLGAPNFGKRGNLLGLVVGQSPKVTANQFQLEGESLRDQDTSLHLELFYRIRLQPGISVTPGVMLITSPEHDEDNPSIVVGTVRTTFRF
ncbi:MAG: iron uptake porin [Alkalinema sp. RL_2_19]|nr:iron uptake porin [Alkalinema sp. RL_2_19]